MPIDLEMILSASPPIFGSPFVDFGYGRFHSNHHRPLGSDPYQTMVEAEMVQSHPCSKKRVWFADDKGLSLTHVRVMTEPSNCPPKWTDEFLAQVVRGVKPSPAQPEHEWAVQFAQPASDYLQFRDKIARHCVSLENVIVREGHTGVTGTIKVKNLAFDKEVFVRATFDRWASSVDFPATFVEAGGSSQYDTFSFSLAIPASAAKFQAVEFCVCFRCSGAEHWDNNSGLNYKLALVTQKNADPLNFSKQVNDALQVNINAWSEFASWNHLSTEGPYW